MTYYLLPIIEGKPVWWRRLVNTPLLEDQYWRTSIGVSGFYVALIVFGSVEDNLLLHDPAPRPAVHRYYASVLRAVGTVMGIGFWVFFANVFLTLRNTKK